MKTVLVKCPYCGLKTEINVEELRDISSLVIVARFYRRDGVFIKPKRRKRK